MKDLKQIQEFFSKPLEENTTDWPKEVSSRYGDIIFRLVKVMSDRAKYELIDAETGKTWEEGGRVYGTVNQLKASAEDTIKPQGGRQSSQFESLNEELNLSNYGKVTLPKGGASLAGSYNSIQGKSKYDTVIFDYQEGSDKPYGIVQVEGYGIYGSDLLKRLGLRQTRSWTSGVDIYIHDGNHTPVYVSEDDFKALLDFWSGGLDREAKAQADFYRGRGNTSGTIDEESLNENKDPIIVKYFKRGDEFIQILVKYEIPVGFTTALGSRTALGQQNDQNEAAAQKRVKTIVNNLKANFDLDDIFVEKGQVAGRYYINAFSDDFIDMDVNDLEGFFTLEESVNEGTLDQGEIAIYIGNDGAGTTHIFKRGKGYYGYNDEFDFEAKDKKDLEWKLKSWGYELLAGSLDESVDEAIGDQIAVGNYVKTQHGDIYKRVEGTVGGRPAFVDVVAGKKGKLKVGKRKTGLHDSVKLTLVNKGELEESLNEASKGALNYFNDLKYYYQKAFSYLDVEEREEYKQLAKDFFSRLQIDDKVRAVGLEENKKLTYNDFVQMVRDDMMAGSSPDEKPSDEQVRRRAKSYYNDYLQGASVDDLFEATKKEENEFHKKLDKLVHKTFGHSSDEKKKMEEYNTGLDYHPSKEKSSSNSKKSSLKKVKDMIKRAVKEGDITVDDKTEFKLNLKHLLDKHIIQKEDLSDYEETEADYDKLYSNYAYKAVKEVFEEKGFSKYLKSKDNPKGETDGLTPDVLNKILMNVVKDIKETNQIDEGASTEEKRIAMSAIKRIAKYRGVGEDEARNDLIRAAKELGSLKEAVKEIFETIELGQNLNEELCPKGKAYIKKRQAAGEKSSAYLSGRAVKVCKGQMKG